MVHSKKILAFLLVLVFVFAQAPMVMAQADQCEIIFEYYDGVDPTGLTNRLTAGLSWAPGASASGELDKTIEGNYYVTEPGWVSMRSSGSGFYTVTTQFMVTEADIAAGSKTVLVENTKTAAGFGQEAPYHESGTSPNLTPIEDRYSPNGNQTIAPYTRTVPRPVDVILGDNADLPEGGPGGTISAEDIADWPDYFALGGAHSVTPDYDGTLYSPAMDPANLGKRPLYQWTTQAEQAEFIKDLNAACGDMYVFSAGATPGGGNPDLAYEIPFVIFTTEDLSDFVESNDFVAAGQILQANDKPTFFWGANIHGNEQSSGEGALAAMYDMAMLPWGDEVIEDINLIIYPRINPTGHARNNRAVQAVPNVQPGTDPNRDHMVFKSKDIWQLHYVWNQFLPEVSMDGHELSGWSYSGTPLAFRNGRDGQSTPATDLNIQPEVTAWALKMSSKQQRDMRQAGLRVFHYGATATTNNNSIGRAYYGNMNALSILVETSGQSNGLLQRRTYYQYATGLSFIDTLRKNADEIRDTVAAARQKVIDMGTIYDPNNLIHVRTVANGPELRLGTIQQYDIRLDGTYVLGSAGTCNAAYSSARARPRPTGYVVPKDIESVEKLLYIFEAQGIEYFEIIEDATLPLEQLYVTNSGGGDPYNPHSNSFAAGLKEITDVSFPNGAYFIPMDQVAGTIIALTMEPDTTSVPNYGTSFAVGLVYANSNDILGGAAASRYLMDAGETDFPIYRLLEDNPRDFVGPFLNEARLTTSNYYVTDGDEISVNGSLTVQKDSNAAVATFKWDTDLFEYISYRQPQDGATLVRWEPEDLNTVDGSLKVVLMNQNDYAIKDLGSVILKAKADQVNGTTGFSLAVQFIGWDEEENKIEKAAETSKEINTVAIENIIIDLDNVTLIDLSNLIDCFGFNTKTAGWFTQYIGYDFNKNGSIDIGDIAYLASLIK